MSVRDAVRANGWIQGALLWPNLDQRLVELAQYEIPVGSVFMVVSQTCDLIQNDLDREPFFEVLCLAPLDREPGGDFLGGKNSRRIEFQYDVDGTENSSWVAIPHLRHFVDRRLLLELRAESFVDESNALRMLLAWLARRYTRTAFPDTFVDQINAGTRRKAIGNKFKRLNPLVAHVFVRLEPFRELEAGEVYALEMILMMASETFDDRKAYAECVEIKNQLEAQIDQCEKIEAVEITVESTAGVTFDDLGGFREWDYSYLSFKDPDEAAAPQENVLTE